MAISRFTYRIFYLGGDLDGYSLKRSTGKRVRKVSEN